MQLVRYVCHKDVLTISVKHNIVFLSCNCSILLFISTALIFRGLDALTTEEGLVKGLTQAFRSVQLAPIKNVAVVRDDLNTSRGFGFVEFHSVSASTNVLDSLNKMDPPLEVDGKQLLINYAKNTFNTT